MGRHEPGMPSSTRKIAASDRRRKACAAFSATASSTGWRSVGELEITRRISLVAVCCSSASVREAFLAWSSVSRRAFSMAMAAWSAKVSIRAIWLSVNGSDLESIDRDHPEQLVRPEHWDRKHGPDGIYLLVTRRCIRGRPGHRECGWCAARVRRAPNVLPRPGEMGFRSTKSLSTGETLWTTTTRRTGPSKRKIERTLGLAQPDRVLGQRLEHRLEIERGPADHLEQLAGRRLLLERHPQLAVARLQLGEEARVLDRDDGLIREGLEQLDLLRGRRDRAPPSPRRSPRSGEPSRIIGTASVAWKPAARAKSFPEYSGSANTSGTLTTSRVRSARTPRRLRSGRIGNDCECRR